MQNQINYIVLFIVALLFFSCDKELDDDLTNGNAGTEVDLPTIGSLGNEAYLNKASDYLFNQEKLSTFELNIPPPNLAILDNDPAAEEYVEGTLIFEGDTITPVGIRYKGSIGAFIGCVSGNDWANPSGFKTCTKLSMKIKMNWEGREDRFYGLNKIQLHSMNQDDSQMHDRFGYWVFNQMGVRAPRAVHSKLIINGQYVGLFMLIEHIDGRFAKHHFDDNDGNLYKEIWPLKSDGEVPSQQAFEAALKTNEEDGSVALIQGFGQEVKEASDNEVPTIIEKYTDKETIISYAAVDRLIRHDDGPFHWYCSGGGCTNHNYFWYEEPTRGKIHLVPWDLDHAFINIIQSQNPVTNIPDDWGEISNNCQPFISGFWGFQQWSAACEKLTGGLTHFEELYDQKFKACQEGPLSFEQSNAVIDKWSEQIRAATSEAAETHNDAISVSQWENAVLELKSQIEFARNR